MSIEAKVKIEDKDVLLECDDNPVADDDQVNNLALEIDDCNILLSIVAVDVQLRDLVVLIEAITDEEHQWRVPISLTKFDTALQLVILEFKATEEGVVDAPAPVRTNGFN